LQELDDTVHKGLPLARVLGHERVLGAALVPTANGDRHLQVWVGVLQVGGLFEAGKTVVVLLLTYFKAIKFLLYTLKEN
jgi:hypothetical protein